MEAAVIKRSGMGCVEGVAEGGRWLMMGLLPQALLDNGHHGTWTPHSRSLLLRKSASFWEVSRPRSTHLLLAGPDHEALDGSYPPLSLLSFVCDASVGVHPSSASLPILLFPSARDATAEFNAWCSGLMRADVPVRIVELRAFQVA